MKTNRWAMIVAAVGLLGFAAVVADTATAQPRDGRGGRGGYADDDRGNGADGWGRGGCGMHRPGFGGPGRGAFGGAGMMGFGFGGGLLRGGSRLADALDLTDAQRKKIEAIREEHHRDMIRTRAEIDLARMDLAKALQDDKATVASIERQIDALARLQADQMKGMAAAHRSARDVLTPKQRDMLKNWSPRDGARDDSERPRRNRR